MEAKKISCQTCGGASFTINDKTARCEYCGAEYDISQMQARAAKLEADEQTLQSVADNLARLRELADQKEAERQKAIEEEKRRQEEEQKNKSKKSCENSKSLTGYGKKIYFIRNNMLNKKRKKQVTKAAVV
ncbi:hypothetical protein IJT93_03445 [bacterium]|nr:hypothetical protein [bacterium]